MIPADAELFESLAHLGVTLSAAIVLVLRDERRLRGDRLARAWTPPSRASALYLLCQIGLPALVLTIHWTRTRASLAGFAWGAMLFVLVEALGFGAAYAVDWVLV